MAVALATNVESKTIAELLDQVRKLIKRYRETAQENEELRNQNLLLNREITGLREQLHQLETERDAIRMQIADLLEEFNKLELE